MPIEPLQIGTTDAGFVESPAQRKAREEELERRAVGQIDPDVIGSLQGQIEAAQKFALEIQTGLNTLAEQEKSTDLAGVVASSDDVVQEEKNIITEVQGLTVPPTGEADRQAASEEIFKILEEERERLEEMRKTEVERIGREFQEVKEDIKGEQRRETGAFTATLARIGGFLGPSASARGALVNLAQNHRTEISALEAKKNDAIRAANNAINAKQFNIARLKAQEVKDLANDINKRRETFFNQTLSIIKEVRAQEAEERILKNQQFKTMTDIVDRIAPSMLASIQEIEGDKEGLDEFITTTAEEFGVDPAILFSKISELQQSGLQFQIQEIQTDQGPRRIRFTFDSSGNMIGQTDLGPSKTARWSSPFLMSTGLLVQQNLDTGEIKKLSNLGGGDEPLPPTPFNIESGLVGLSENQALDIFTATDVSPVPAWYISEVETEFAQPFSVSEMGENWTSFYKGAREKAVAAAKSSGALTLIVDMSQAESIANEEDTFAPSEEEEE